MPRDYGKATPGSNNLLYPGDLEGIEFKLLKRAMYELDGDDPDDGFDHPSDLPLVEEENAPQWGRWLLVAIDDAGEEEKKLMNVPSELLEELQDMELEAGESAKITRCEQPGNEETDPYEVNAVKTKGNQTGL